MNNWIDFYDFKHSVIYVNARHRDVHYRAIAEDICHYLPARDAQPARAVLGRARCPGSGLSPSNILYGDGIRAHPSKRRGQAMAMTAGSGRTTLVTGASRLSPRVPACGRAVPGSRPPGARYQIAKGRWGPQRPLCPQQDEITGSRFRGRCRAVEGEVWHRPVAWAQRPGRSSR